MLRIPRFLLVSVLLVSVLSCGLVQPLSAQQEVVKPKKDVPKSGVPQITIMLNSIDELTKDIEVLMKLAGPKGKTAWESLEIILPVFIEGIDKKKPIFVDIVLVKEKGKWVPRYRVSVPVSALKAFKSNLATFEFKLKKVPGQVNFWSLQFQPDKEFRAFMKFAGGYASLAMTDVVLKDLPKREKLVARIGKNDILLHATSDAATMAGRKLNFGLFRKDLDALVEDKDTVLKLAWGQILDEVQRLYVEASELTVAWETKSVKPLSGKGQLTVVAHPESSLKKSTALLGKQPSMFASVKPSPKSILHFRVNHAVDEMRKTNFGLLLPAIKKDIQTALDESKERTDEEKKKAKLQLDEFFGMLTAGVGAGLVDGFLDIEDAGKGKRTVVGAINAVNGKLIDNVLKLFVESKAERKLKLEIDQQDDVSIHELTVADKAMGTLEEILGVKGKLYVGSSANAIWYAAGADALAQLKAMIKQSKVDADNGAGLTVLSLDAKLLPWIEFYHKKRNEQDKERLAEPMKGEAERAKLKAQIEDSAELRELAIAAFKKGEDQLSINFHRVTEKDKDTLTGELRVGVGVLRYLGEVFVKYASILEG